MALPDQIESRENLPIQTTVLGSRDRALLPERYVDAVAAAQFLSLKRRRVLDMARSGSLKAHPIGTGARKTWRFRLSELEHFLSPSGANCTASSERRTYRSRQSPKAENGR
jgi:hypothetical protein